MQRTQNPGVVLRITRHPLDADREAFLREVFGSEIQVVTADIPYGDDAVAAIKNLVADTEEEFCLPVVAIEAQAPFPVLMRLVDNRRELGVPLIRSQFERDGSGRAIVVGKDKSGRDLLKFSHYEELVRIEFETRPLRAPGLGA